MKTTPLIQQNTALQRARGRKGFAFFMEQGTGKSWVVLAEAECGFYDGAFPIHCLVIVAPNGVHRNWIEREAPKHLSVPFRTQVWSAAKINTIAGAKSWEDFLKAPTDKYLKVAAFNVEGFRTKGSKPEKMLQRLLLKHRCMMIVDESQTIKSPSAHSSKVLARLGKFAPIKRLLSGTPMTESPLDAYAQFRFLGKHLLGFQDYALFKAHFAQWEQVYTGHKDPKTGRVLTRPELIRYQHLDQLKTLIDTHAYTVRKSDCLDLPPKVYEVRPVELPAEHRALYRRAQKEVLIELEAERRKSPTMTIKFAFTRLVRLAQITGGFFAADGKTLHPIGATNPKITSLLGLIEDMPREAKVIIWCRFIHECEAVCKALMDVSKKWPVAYWGDIDEDTRSIGIDRFQNDPDTRFFVGTAAAGGVGITLTAASQVAYLSCGYSATQRQQSEDRSHRIGTTQSVTYTDLPVLGTVDELVLRIVAAKIELGELFKDSVGDLIAWMRSQADE
jgi:hypothetical protein